MFVFVVIAPHSLNLSLFSSGVILSLSVWLGIIHCWRPSTGSSLSWSIGGNAKEGGETLVCCAVLLVFVVVGRSALHPGCVCVRSSTMATEAQARVSFSTDVPELQNRVPRTPFSVPVNVNASGLSEIVSHLLRLGKAKPQFFSFLVVEDGTLLHSSIENYLVEHHKSSEHVLNLKFFPASHGPEPAASIPCPDWISGISLALPGCVVVSCYNGSAEIRTAHGEEVLTVCAGHSAPVKAVSTCRHGEDGGFRMVTASKDHSLLLWEGNLECSKKASSNEEEATSASVKQVARGHHLKSVECVAMAGPDRFFSGSWDGTVKLWSWPGARNNNSSANDDAGNDDDSEDLPAPAKRSRKPSKAGAAGAAAAGAGAAEEEGGDLLSVATFAGHTNQVSCLTVLESESATAAAAATASGQSVAVIYCAQSKNGDASCE